MHYRGTRSNNAMLMVCSQGGAVQYGGGMVRQRSKQTHIRAEPEHGVVCDAFLLQHRAEPPDLHIHLHNRALVVTVVNAWAVLALVHNFAAVTKRRRVARGGSAGSILLSGESTKAIRAWRLAVLSGKVYDRS